MKSVELFTDGACKGNPGPGGWGVLLRYKDQEKPLFGGLAQTTNNQMELMAVIEGLKALNQPCKVKITTDSSYVKNGMESWLAGWKKNNWKGSNKKPVKNKELWQQLDAEVQKHDVSWAWVKGHSGHRENEIADELANKGCEKFL